MIKHYLGFILMVVSAGVNAWCDGGYPNISVEHELKVSDFVVSGVVISRKVLVDYELDPQGYEAEVFQVKVKHIIAGQPKEYVTKQYLTIYNENTSARFVMEKGKEYLLFISEGADGFWVNSCGNSSELSGSKKNLEKINKYIKK